MSEGKDSGHFRMPGFIDGATHHFDLPGLCNIPSQKNVVITQFL